MSPGPDEGMPRTWSDLDASAAASAQMIDWYAPATRKLLVGVWQERADRATAEVAVLKALQAKLQDRVAPEPTEGVSSSPPTVVEQVCELLAKRWGFESFEDVRPVQLMVMLKNDAQALADAGLLHWYNEKGRQ